jgi:hypothetical protein
MSGGRGYWVTILNTDQATEQDTAALHELLAKDVAEQSRASKAAAPKGAETDI